MSLSSFREAPALPGSQETVVASLLQPGVVDSGPVEHIETHIAHVFVGANRAVKIKRAIRLPFLDFSSLEKRRLACLREIEVNEPMAPDLYRGVVAVTQKDDGSLALGGPGPAVEWAVEMRAFKQEWLLSRRAAAGTLDEEVLKATADRVVEMHRSAAVAGGTDAPAKVRSIISDIAAACRSCSGWPDPSRIETWRDLADNAVSANEALLRERAARGKVRRCHGDLHLANIVMWHGRPTPFDAIEFSDEIATIDILYDLAFLLMDLEHRVGRSAANIVLNRYCWRTGNEDEISGLALLGPFMSLRAAVRAMVAAERHAIARDRSKSREDGSAVEAAEYLERAIGYLQPVPVRLIAIGGLSGTGKSTLARALAPLTADPAGALHLRSDLERKALAGVDETARLPAASYTSAASAEVYARLLRRARHSIAAGHSTIIDAVFGTEAERKAAEQIACDAGVAFEGVWLEASPSVMRNRVGQRQGDASDATPEVVDLQLGRDPGSISWRRTSADQKPDDTLKAARAALLL